MATPSIPIVAAAAVTPSTPAPSTASVDLNALVSDLRSHTLNMSLLNVFVLVLALCACGFVYLHTVRSFDAAMSKADAKDATYQKTLDAFQDQLKIDGQTIAQLAAQKAQVQTQVVYRDTQADKLVQTVSAPGRAPDAVSQDLLNSYGFGPDKVDGDLFEFTVPHTQQFVTTKVDRDRLSQDNTDDLTQLNLQEKITVTTQSDLASAQSALKDAGPAIAAYKAVAKKSKFRKVLDVAWKVGLFAGGLYIGSHL